MKNMIEIAYAEDWLSDMSEWGASYFNPQLTYTEKIRHKDHHYTNAQKIWYNLHALGRLDRTEWANNIDIISRSIEPNPFDHIHCIKVNKIKISGNYLILHVKITLMDNKQFECSYLLSNTLNLCGNIFHIRIANDDCDDDQSDTASNNDNSSLDLTSLNFELPQSQRSCPREEIQIDVDDASDDIEPDSENPLSVSSDGDIPPSDEDLSAEDELASIFTNDGKQKAGKADRKSPSLPGGTSWQFDTFRRSFMRTPALPDQNRSVLSDDTKNKPSSW